MRVGVSRVTGGAQFERQRCLKTSIFAGFTVIQTGKRRPCGFPKSLKLNGKVNEERYPPHSALTFY